MATEPVDEVGTDSETLPVHLNGEEDSLPSESAGHLRVSNLD